ncbi:MAG: arsenic resistance N-acetyltransferase ArsN2 [Gemmatimonadales bacterium]
MSIKLDAVEAGALPEVRALLGAAALPVADLDVATPEFFGLRDNAGLIGVIGLERHGQVALLRSLAVRSDQRGKGLGTALVRALEERASALGVRELWLLTTTAEPFFRQLGYEAAIRGAAPVAIRETGEFRSICPSSAACLTRLLP